MSLADDINNLSFKNIGTWPLPIKIGSMLILLGLLHLSTLSLTETVALISVTSPSPSTQSMMPHSLTLLPRRT